MQCKNRLRSRNGLYYSRKLFRSVKNSPAPTGTFCHPFSPCIPIPHGAIKPSKLNNTGVNFLSVTLESSKPILGRIFWIHTAVGDDTEGEPTSTSAFTSTSTNPSPRALEEPTAFPMGIKFKMPSRCLSGATKRMSRGGAGAR